jgi:S1-C subfamily serine protease
MIETALEIQMMKLRVWRLLVVITCFGVGLSAAYAQNDRMENATVRIVVKETDGTATGSGFVIGNGRYVVTNHHVIKGASEIYILSKPLGHRVRGTVVVDSQEKDLAVLQMEDGVTATPVALVLNSGVRKRETVYAAGFPAAADDQGDSINNFLEVKFSQGIISGYVNGPSGEALYQITAALNPGNSGGPLFDECDRAIGINVEKSLVKAVIVGQNGEQSTERVPLGEGIAWSIRADELVTLLRANNIPVAVESNVCVPGSMASAPPPVLPPDPGKSGGRRSGSNKEVVERSKSSHGFLFIASFLAICLVGGLIVLILRQS